jgi:putative transposase
MLIQKAFRLRLYPNKQQREALLCAGGATRWLWNHLLDQQIEKYKNENKFIFYKKLTADLPVLKTEYEWLNTAPASSLQRVCRHLDKALRASFKTKTKTSRKGFPRFKSKSLERDAFYLTNQQTRILNNRIDIPKIGSVRFRTGATPEGRYLSTTIKQDGNLWWAVVLCEIEISNMITDSPKNVVGIDLGLKEFITTSDGEVIANPRLGRKAAKRLSRAQRVHSRRQKGSKRKLKARRRVQAIHRKTRNQRSNFLHRTSAALVRDYDIICTEDLCIKGLARTRLARSIHDTGWGELLRQIDYKMRWAGKNHVRIHRFAPSSQACSACGERQRLTLSQRTYRCSCGNVMDRDLNAAINIRNWGMEKLGACRAETTPVEIPLMEPLLLQRQSCIAETGNSLSMC